MASLSQHMATSAGPCLRFRSCGFAGKRVTNKGWAPRDDSRIFCVRAVAEHRKKSNLLAEAEEGWLRAVENPSEGLNFTPEDFSEALSKYDFSFEIGDTVKGAIFLADNNGASIDIGGKAPAFLPLSEASILSLKSVEEIGLFPGAEEEFYIINDDDAKGRMILSLRKIQYDLAWERCKQLQAEDAVVNGLVLSTNRGGVVVDVEGLRGFVPFSLLSLRTTPEELIGKVIPLKFREVDEEQTRLVLRNRQALAETHTSLSVGSVVEGIVLHVKPYGAFIDIGGISGLLHISQISHDRITDVGSVLQPGDKLKVMILSQDHERGRISLSTKKLEPTPGDMLRNPSLVYESAEEMATTFRQRVAQAVAAARAEELRMNQEGGGFGFRSDSALGNLGLALDELDLSSAPPAVEA